MQIKIKIIMLLAFVICVGLLVFNRPSYDFKKTNRPKIEVIYSDTNNDTIKNIEEPTTEITTDVNVETPSFLLSNYERWIVECVVMGESGNEPYDGQILVAQCMLNACLKDDIQPSKVRTKYKYSGWKDKPTDSVKNAVSAVFDDGYRLTDEFILYFYAPKYSKGRWHETQRFVIEVGGHRFFAEWDD